MVQKTLDKIRGTKYYDTLENKKRERKKMKELRLENAAETVKASIAGYVQAMRDCGIITERERQALFIYYATV